jgi:hypothetical protein
MQGKPSEEEEEEEFGFMSPAVLRDIPLRFGSVRLEQSSTEGSGSHASFI